MRECPREQAVRLLTQAAERAAEHAGHRTVVVLGRDAWPLVPLLRRRGAKTQYFVWSRLQTGDPATERQWLWETPPGSLVVDTGYAGSIINRIRELDPTVSGALMSSSVPSIYPSLCDEKDRTTIVGDIEYAPKLIPRIQKMDRGRLVYSGGYDGTVQSAHDVLAWNATLCRELQVAPEWARFTGMTPWSRIGCRPSEVPDHYGANLLARLEQELLVEPSPYRSEFGAGGVGGGEYSWKKQTLKKKEESPLTPEKKENLPPPPPPGVTLTTDEGAGIDYAMFDHLLMIDWDVDDGSHVNARRQCLVDSAGEAWLRLTKWCEKHPEYTFHFYLTPGGARAFCTSHYFHPKDEGAQQMLKSLRCDRLYREMSRRRGVWGCRISPKPGRPDDYVARYVGSVGKALSNWNLVQLVIWHDAQCAKFGGGGIDVPPF